MPAQLQLSARPNGTLVLDRGEKSLSLASFTKTRDGEKLITLVAWYVNRYHRDVQEIRVRANGSAAMRRWLADTPVVNGIRFVEA